MKKLLLLLMFAFALSTVVVVRPPSVSASPKASKSSDWYCTAPAYGSCIGGWNWWNHHYVYNFGDSTMLCEAKQPNGARQGWAWVPVGEERTVSAWNYNRIECRNSGAQTTLHIISY